MADWRVVSNIDYVLRHNARLRHDHNRPMGSNGCIFTQFAYLYMPYKSFAGLLHCTVAKPNPKPGFRNYRPRSESLVMVSFHQRTLLLKVSPFRGQIPHLRGQIPTNLPKVAWIKISYLRSCLRYRDELLTVTPSNYSFLSYPRNPPSTKVSVSYTHLRAHETRHDLVCRLLLAGCFENFRVLSYVFIV